MLTVSYPYPNGMPVVTITLERNIKVKNEAMPYRTPGLLVRAHDLPAQNQKDIVIKLHGGVDASDTFKIVVEPSYAINGPYMQYLKGKRTTYWRGKKEEDNRIEDIIKEYTRALTGVHKLASQRDLAKLKKLVKEAVPMLDKAERKR